MARWLEVYPLVLVLAAGCDQPADLLDAEGDVLQRSGSQVLVVPPLVAGELTDLVVTGALPGDTVVFVRSGSPGTGPCPPVLGGLCLDLDPGSARPLGSVTADAAGVATLSFLLPATTSGLTVHLQAVIPRGVGGVDSVKTDLVVQQICDDVDNDGFGACHGDCDDSDPSAHPGATDVACDGVDLDCDGGQELAVPGTHPTIQAGIDAALSGDEVCVAAGTFLETLDFGGKAITVQGQGAGVTIVDGDGPIGLTTIEPVVRFDSGEGPDSRLAGLSVTGGYAAQGAGLFLSGASPTIEDVEVVGNFYDKPLPASLGLCEGVGVHVDGGSPTLRRVDIVDNRCELDQGILTGAGLFLTSDTSTLEDVTIQGNSQDSHPGLFESALLLGAGLYMDGSSPQITGLTVSGNTQVVTTGTASGAGIYGEYMDLALTDATIEDNVQLVTTGLTAHGAGLYLKSGDLDLTHTVVRANVTDAGQGWAKGVGIHLASASSSASLVDVQLLDNVADSEHAEGVGMYAEGPIDLHRSVVAGNRADTVENTYGVGLNGAAITMTNTVLADNTATSHNVCGGAALDATDVELTQVIIANNDCHTTQLITTHASGAVTVYGNVVAVQVDLVDNLVNGSTSFIDGVGLTVHGSTTDHGVELLNTNLTDGLACTGTATLDATYSNLLGSVAGCVNPAGIDGNLATDPLYVDTSGTSALDWDLHLGATSPLIDLGDPALDDVDGSRSDMGAFGGLGAVDW